MEKSDSDIPRVDLYRKIIVLDKKKYKKYKLSQQRTLIAKERESGGGFWCLSSDPL